MRKWVIILISFVFLIGYTGVSFAGSIRGRITTESSDGIPNVLVQAYANPCWSNRVGEAWTDTNGNYTIDNLPAGDYYVVACSGCTHLNYFQEWYDGAGGTTSCGLAEPIFISDAQNIYNIDFSLKVGPRKILVFDVTVYNNELHSSFFPITNFGRFLKSATLTGPEGFSYQFDFVNDAVYFATECRPFGTAYYHDFGSQFSYGTYTLTLSFANGSQSTYTKNLQNVPHPIIVNSASMSYVLNHDGSIDFYWTPPDPTQEYDLRIRDSNGAEYLYKTHLSGTTNHIYTSPDDLRCLEKGKTYKWFIRSYKEPIEYPFGIGAYSAVGESERKDLVYNPALDIQRTTSFWIADWRGDFFANFGVRPGSVDNVTSASISGPEGFSYSFNLTDDYFDFSTDARFFRGWHHRFDQPIVYGNYYLSVEYSDGYSDLFIPRSLSPVSVEPVDWHTMNLQIYENGDMDFSWELPAGVAGQIYNVRVRNIDETKEYYCSSNSTDATGFTASAWDLRGLEFGSVYKWVVRSYDPGFNTGRESKWLYFRYDPFNIACIPDIDRDGDVDGTDLADLADHFGEEGCPNNCNDDFDVNGSIDSGDISSFASKFGHSDCPVYNN